MTMAGGGQCVVLPLLELGTRSTGNAANCRVSFTVWTIRTFGYGLCCSVVVSTKLNFELAMVWRAEELASPGMVTSQWSRQCWGSRRIRGGEGFWESASRSCARRARGT